jgi:predicted aspartyl protease
LKVNGEKNPLRFVLDTGSGMSVVSEATAKRLGLRPIARGGMARAVGGGGRFEIVYGFLSSLEVGDVRVENVPVYIRHFFDEKTPVDGYLGLSVISKFITSIDSGKRTFTLARNRSSDSTDPWNIVYRPESQPADTTTPRPLAVDIPLRTTSSGFMSGEVRIEGVDKIWNFIIDTGASISVVSEELAVAEGMSEFVQRERTRVYGAAGITDNVKTLLLPRVMLGSLTKEKVSAAVLDLDPVNETSGFRQSGILGSNFLRHFRVSFDFQRGLIRLEPLSQRTQAAESIKPKEM